MRLISTRLRWYAARSRKHHGSATEGTRQQWEEGTLAAMEASQLPATGGPLDLLEMAGHTADPPTRTQSAIGL